MSRQNKIRRINSKSVRQNDPSTVTSSPKKFWNNERPRPTGLRSYKNKSSKLKSGLYRTFQVFGGARARHKCLRGVFLCGEPGGGWLLSNHDIKDKRQWCTRRFSVPYVSSGSSLRKENWEPHRTTGGRGWRRGGIDLLDLLGPWLWENPPLQSNFLNFCLVEHEITREIFDGDTSCVTYVSLSVWHIDLLRDAAVLWAQGRRTGEGFGWSTLSLTLTLGKKRKISLISMLSLKYESDILARSALGVRFPAWHRVLDLSLKFARQDWTLQCSQLV